MNYLLTNQVHGSTENIHKSLRYSNVYLINRFSIENLVSQYVN